MAQASASSRGSRLVRLGVAIGLASGLLQGCLAGPHPLPPNELQDRDAGVLGAAGSGAGGGIGAGGAAGGTREDAGTQPSDGGCRDRDDAGEVPCPTPDDDSGATH